MTGQEVPQKGTAGTLYSLAQVLVEAVEGASCAPKVLRLDNDQCLHPELLFKVVIARERSRQSPS